jgi:hypothetical protein
MEALIGLGLTAVFGVALADLLWDTKKLKIKKPKPKKENGN